MRLIEPRLLEAVCTLLTLVMAGCASGQGVPDAAVAASGTDPGAGRLSAELIDCADFPSAEPDPRSNFVIVTVPVDVDSDGVVAGVGAPRAQRAGGNQQVLDVGDKDVVHRSASRRLRGVVLPSDRCRRRPL